MVEKSKVFGKCKKNLTFEFNPAQNEYPKDSYYVILNDS